MEIDDASDFLQIRSENYAADKSYAAREITGDETIHISDEFRDVSLLELEVSVRLDNVLRSLNVRILGDLNQKSLSEIQNAKNCGRKTIDELCQLIERFNGDIEFEEAVLTNEANKKISVPESLENVAVKTAELSVRLTNVLDKLNITTFGDLQNFCLAEIKTTENCGRKTVEELKILVDGFQDENWINEIISKSQNQPNPRSEKENVSVAASIGDISINRFALSTRLAKVLESLDIETLGDFEKFSMQEIKQTKNFGKKTLAELRSFVARIEQTSEPRDLIEAQAEAPASELNLNALLDFINRFLKELSAREREIFVERLGGADEGNIPTLEDLGEKFSVTRERVRQIESKIFKQLISRLSGVADDALKRIKFASETEICPVSARFLTDLTGNDYDLFVYPPNFYLHVLKKLSPEIYIYAGRETPLQSNVNLAKLVQTIKSMLDDEVHFSTLAEVYGRLLAHRIFDEHTINDFFAAIQNDKFIIENGDQPNVLLIATDKNRLTMTEMAWQILKNSEAALLPEEIIAEGEKLFGAEIEFHSARSLANLPSYDDRFYLLDKRTIGLRQHFKLPEEKWNEVIADFYALLAERRKPISTTEVVNHRLFGWTAQTTPSETAEILREDGRFKDLGRFLFALAEWQIEEREPVKDLVVKILQATDDALTATEIGARVQKYRSVATTSMPTILREHPDLETFDFGGSDERMRLAYYGLKSKGDYRKFFAGNETVLKRLVKKFFPLTFADLCRKLGFDADGELAATLWQTLEKIPEIRFTPADRSPETIVKFSHWHLKSRK